MAILNTNEIMFTAFEPKVQNRFIMYIDGMGDLKRERESRWLSGWRPNNTRGFGK